MMSLNCLGLLRAQIKRGPLTLVMSLVLLGTSLAQNADSVQLQGSPIIRTMTRELKRSMANLKLKGSPQPYFISYLLWDTQSYHMQASLGTCEMSDQDRQHILEVDLRVGDYHLDNTNFQGGLVFGPQLRLPLPQDNDTTLLALSMWAATDARYKVAIEQIAQKKAFLTNHSIKDTLPDFSRQQVKQKYFPGKFLLPDTAKAITLGKELSLYLAGYPWLLESRVAYQYYFTNFYYVDSEGSRFIQSIPEHTLLVSLFTQAHDGTPLWDYLRISTRDLLNLGNGNVSLAALKDSLAPMLRRLQTLRTAAAIPNYRGPVLFTGTAAGELLEKALINPQQRLREPLGASSEPNFMVSVLGRKLFPSDVTVLDQPSQQSFQGHSLYGNYAFDHQGQPAQDIVLIKDGRVKDFYLGKIPVNHSKGHVSNGHWRFGRGFGGVVSLQSTKAVGETELKSRMAAMGIDEGTGYALEVSKILDEDAFKLLRHPLATQLLTSDGSDSRGSFGLAPPCELDQIDSKTGQRTPVRGLAFPVLDSKSLRNIVGVGSEPYLHEPQASFSILCPSLLFSLLDLKGSRSTQPHLPLIP